jgi:hypothetical protein
MSAHARALALEQYRGLENARGVQRIEKTLEQL